MGPDAIAINRALAFTLSETGTKGKALSREVLLSDLCFKRGAHCQATVAQELSINP